MSYYAAAAFPKQLRKRDPKLLARIRMRPCLICFKRPVEASHIRSRGAGGDDSEANVIPLCHRCHREWHRLGCDSMAEKYQAIAEFLRTHGQ